MLDQCFGMVEKTSSTFVLLIGEFIRLVNFSITTPACGFQFNNMATYTIKTNRSQEIGLKFNYDTYADKTVYPTQESWFQYKINNQVTDPMFQEQQRASSIAFDQSFATIPELEQPAARTEIEGVITNHGGTIVQPGPPPIPPPPGAVGGVVPVVRGEGSNPVQAGAANQTPPNPSGRDGSGDNEA